MLSFFLLTCIATTALAAPFIPAQTYSPNFATATIWANATTSSLRVYFPNNGTLQELRADFTQLKSPWTPSPAITAFNVSVNDYSPMASASSKDQSRVFFYDSWGHLREQIYNGINWTLGDLDVPVGWFGPKLAAIGYTDLDGAQAFSVWCTQADGGLYEASQTGNASWVINAVGHSQGPGGLFGKAWIEDGKLMKRVYFQDNLVNYELRQATWNVQSDVASNIWSNATTAGFQYHPKGPIVFSGLTLPSSAERLYVNPESNTQVWEYTRTGPQATFWSQWPPTVTQGRMRELSYVAAVYGNVDGGGDQMFVFFEGLDGRLAYTRFSYEAGWVGESTTITTYSS